MDTTGPIPIIEGEDDLRDTPAWSAALAQAIVDHTADHITLDDVADRPTATQVQSAIADHITLDDVADRPTATQVQSAIDTSTADHITLDDVADRPTSTELSNRVQRLTETLTLVSQKTGYATFDFSPAFASTPSVVATADNSYYNVGVEELSTTQCEVRARHIHDTAQAVTFTITIIATDL